MMVALLITILRPRLWSKIDYNTIVKVDRCSEKMKNGTHDVEARIPLFRHATPEINAEN